MASAMPHHQNMGTRRSRAAALRNWFILESRPVPDPAA
jgi:hypothetical protein